MKTIRLIIAISLIIGAFALDMSSTKRRTETSSYVSMYTAMGLQYGYKELAMATDSNDAMFKWYLQFADGKKIGENNSVSVMSFVNKNMITFPLSFQMSTAIPADMKNYCKFSCEIKEVKTFHLEDYQDAYRYKVVFNNNGKDVHFYIVITNGADLPQDGLVSKERMIQEETTFKQNNRTENKFFIEALVQGQQAAADAAKHFALIKDKNVNKLNEYKKTYEEFKKEYEKYLKQKQQLEAEQAALLAKIAAKKEELNNTIQKAKSCETEVIELISKIQNLQEIVKAAQAARKKKIDDLTKAKAQCAKEFYYFIEAGYFYRVFAEKLIAAEADVENALSGNNLKTTKNKITKAFYPIKVVFPDMITKK